MEVRVQAAAAVWVRVQAALVVVNRVREEAGWEARVSGSEVNVSARTAGQKLRINAGYPASNSSVRNADQPW